MVFRRIRYRFRLVVAVQLLALSTWAAPTKTEYTGNPPTNVGEQLGEDAALVRATGLYDTGQYAACVDALELLLDPDEPRRLRSVTKVESARVYRAACLIGVGRTTEAEQVFRDAILENPQMKPPDGLIFPEAVVDVFLRVRESMLDEIRRAEVKRMQDAEARAQREQRLREDERQRVEQLVAIAEKETVIERRSRAVASIPFGVGQFQNGNKGLGWLFFATEMAASGVLVGSLYMQLYYHSKFEDPAFTTRDLRARADTAYLVQTVSFYGLLGIGLVGIAEAHLSFVPEVRFERKRVLPEHLKLLPPKAARAQPAVSLRLTPWAAPGIAGASVSAAF
jgi:hypothetical protein